MLFNTADATRIPTSTATGGIVSIVDDGAETTAITVDPAPVSILAPLLPGAPDAPSLALDRFQLIANATFTTAAAMGAVLSTIDLPDAITATPYVTNRMSYYRYLRTGARIKVTADSNRFLYGSLIIGIDQSSCMNSATTGGTFDGVCYVTGMPHCILDVNSPEGEELSVSWIGPDPGMDMMAVIEPAKLARIFIQVMAPLTPVSSSAVTGGVSINVYAMLEDATIDGPIGLEDTVALAAERVPEVAQMRRAAGGAGAGAGASAEARDKSIDGLITGVAKFAGAAAKDLLPEPIMSGLGTIGRWFGYDFPLSVSAPTITMSKAAQRFGMGEGLDQSSLLSVYAPLKPLTGPKLGQLRADEMALPVMASTPSILATFTISESQAPGTVLWSTPVNPHVMQESSAPLADVPSFVPTFLAAASIPFVFWRGSITYMLYISCSTSHNARIRFTFQPMDDGSGGSWDKKQAITSVQQITGPSMVPFTVPFIFPQAWAMESIGRLYVTVESQLAPIGDVVTAPMRVFAYVLGGSDFQVAELSGTYLCSQVCAAYPVEAGAGAGAGSGEKPEFRPLEEAERAVSAGNTAGYTTTCLRRDGTFTPEVYRDWATAMRVPELWIGSQAWLGTPASSTDPRIVSYLDVHPCGYQVFSLLEQTGPPPWGPAPSDILSGFIPHSTLPSGGLVSWATPVGQAAPGPLYKGRGYLYWTLLDHVAQFYRFQTGGVRLKAIMEDTNTTIRSPGHVVVRKVPSGSTCGILGSTTSLYPPFVVPASVSVTEGPAAPASGPMAFESSALGSGSLLEVEVPRAAKTLFTTNVCPDTFSPTVVKTIGDQTRRYYTGDRMSLVLIEQEYGAKIRALYRGAADDLVFVGLRLPFGVAVVKTVRFGYFYEPSMLYATVATLQAQWGGIVLA